MSVCGYSSLIDLRSCAPCLFVCLMSHVSLTGVSHSQHRKNIGRGFGKNAGEWTGRVEKSKKEILGSKM